MAEPMSERERRELAEQNRDSVVLGSGVPVEGRRLGQMVSLRLEPEILGMLRDIANQRGVTVSDLLRDGAAMIIEASQQVMEVTHFSLGVQVTPARTGRVGSGASPSGSVARAAVVEINGQTPRYSAA
jgi:hypothetical protein